MTPETSLRRQICSWLTMNGALIFVHDSVGIFDPTRKVFRTNKDPFRRKGVSDVIGIWKNRFLAIECKIKGKYPTKEQKEFLKDVNENGGIGILAYKLEDVQSALKEGNI